MIFDSLLVDGRASVLQCQVVHPIRVFTAANDGMYVGVVVFHTYFDLVKLLGCFRSR